MTMLTKPTSGHHENFASFWFNMTRSHLTNLSLVIATINSINHVVSHAWPHGNHVMVWTRDPMVTNEGAAS
jgi:hypothetical protein